MQQNTTQKNSFQKQTLQLDQNVQKKPPLIIKITQYPITHLCKFYLHEIRNGSAFLKRPLLFLQVKWSPLLTKSKKNHSDKVNLQPGSQVPKIELSKKNTNQQIERREVFKVVNNTLRRSQ